MKLISWNVNGFRACLTKGFETFFKEMDADIFCIQETKMQEGQAIVSYDGYFQYWNSAEKKGYSGTAIFTKKEPLNVIYGLPEEKHNTEGRVITLEYPEFYFVGVYTPNAQRELTRLGYRVEWEQDFRNYLKLLDQKKPVIVCGDMNVAHQEIDLKNPKTNVGNAGFTKEEREEMTKLLDSGFVDTFRYLYPNKTDVYSWWSYMHHARERNIGWRIDYFLVSNRMKEEIKDSKIYMEIAGSDHCPVGLEIF